MGHSSSKFIKTGRELVCLSDAFIVSVRQQFEKEGVEDVNSLHPSLRDYPLCIASRRGDFRLLLALLHLGAKPNVVSALDGLSCVALAVRARCAFSVYALFDFGAQVKYEDAVTAAMIHDRNTMRVIASRIDKCDWEPIVSAILYANEYSDEMIDCLKSVPFTVHLAELVLLLCCSKRFWRVMNAMVDFWTRSSPSTRRLSDSVSSVLIENLDKMPSELRTKLVPFCDFEPLYLRSMFETLPYGSLVQCVEAKCVELAEKDDGWIDMVALWSYPLSEDGFTLVHLICSKGDSCSLYFALEHNAPVHSTTRLGNTPLHMLVGIGDCKHCVELLVDHGADAKRENTKGLSPLDMWKRANLTELIEIAE